MQQEFFGVVTIKEERKSATTFALLLFKGFLDCSINFTNTIPLDAETLIDDDSVTVDDIGAGDSAISQERVCLSLWIPCQREGKVRVGLLKPEDSVLILLSGDGDGG